MNRRRFTIGLGTLAAGSAAAVGTGAFTSVEADRGVSVDVASDSEAFLGISSDSEYVSDGDDVFFIDLGGPTTTEGGEGFNKSARTEIPEIVTFDNQGTQPVAVGFEADPTGDGGNEVVRDFPGEQSSDNDIRVTLTVPEADQTIDAGNSVSMDLAVNSRDGIQSDIDPGTDRQGLTIFAVDEDQGDGGDGGFQ